MLLCYSLLTKNDFKLKFYFISFENEFNMQTEGNRIKCIDLLFHCKYFLHYILPLLIKIYVWTYLYFIASK